MQEHAFLPGVAEVLPDRQMGHSKADDPCRHYGKNQYCTLPATELTKHAYAPLPPAELGSAADDCSNECTTALMVAWASCGK